MLLLLLFFPRDSSNRNSRDSSSIVFIASKEGGIWEFLRLLLPFLRRLLLLPWAPITSLPTRSEIIILIIIPMRSRRLLHLRQRRNQRFNRRRRRRRPRRRHPSLIGSSPASRMGVKEEEEE